MTKNVAIIIPALNEEESIADVIERVFAIGQKNSDYNLQPIVVDGHSTDDTVKIAKEKGARIINQKGNGKGVGIRQAVELCSPKNVVLKTLSLSSGACNTFSEMLLLLDSEYIIMLDADGTYPPEHIPELISALEKESDVVMGSRFKGKIEENAMTSMNKVGNVVLSVIASLMYGQKCSDICTGMWAFRSEALRVLELESKHFELEAELFAESVKKGLRVTEIPISYLPRRGKTKLVPMAAGIAILSMIIKRRFINANGQLGIKHSKNKEISANTINSG